MDTKVLCKNWNVQADPFYAMYKRTGHSLDDVQSLTPAEAVRVVFGDAVGDAIAPDGDIEGSLQNVTLFATWCYMYLRQKVSTVNCPVNLGEEFYLELTSAPFMGADLLCQIGQQLTDDAVIKEARKVMETLIGAGDKYRENLSRLAQAYGLIPSAIRQGLLSACISKLTDRKVLTFAACQNVIEEVVGVAPSNLVYVNPNWIRFGDFLATAQDVAVVLNWLSRAFSDVFEVKSCDDGFNFWVEGTQFHCTSKDGVFHIERNRHINGMLLVNSSTGRHPTEPVDPENLSLVNSYGTVIYALLYGAPGYVNKGKGWDSFVNKVLVKGDEYPLTSEDEVGPADGDRKFHERYVTVTRPQPVDVPFALIRFTDGWFLSTQSVSMKTGYATESENSVRLPQNSSIDKAALWAFNLVRMPSGALIDGRRSCIQLRHTQQPANFAKAMMLNLAGTDDILRAEGYARSIVKVPDGKDTWEHLGEYLIVGLSSKLAKLIKRTASDAAVVAKLEDGQSRGFKRFGQTNESTNNWLVESVVSAHAIWPAGMACYWGDEPQLLVDHTESIQLPFKGDVDETTVSVPYTEYMGEVYLEDGWFKVTMTTPIPIDKGGLAGEVQVCCNGIEYPFAITSKTPDAQLVGVEWQERRGYGDLKTLFVKVRTITVESEIKARNGVKAMLTRYDRRCLSLNNEDIAARAIFFKDTNKWLDLATQICDIAACTAIQNKDPQGLALIHSANAAAGVSHSDYLEWSPVLAMIGVYQPLLNWFESKFGRSIWFKWEDSTCDWTTVLRLMYTKHDSPNEAERAEPVAGWSYVDHDKLDFLPSTASDVLAIADGDFEDEHTNVVVIYRVGGIEYFVQRAYSFAGTSATGPVWQPVKAELSSVRAGVTQSPLMSGVIRAVEGKDLDYATRLAADGLQHVQRASTVTRMARGLGGVQNVVLGTPDAMSVLCTEELQELVTNPLLQGQLVRKLAEQFPDTFFIVPGAYGTFSLHLPTVVEQDGSDNLCSSVTMAGLTAQLLSLAILGAGADDKVFCAIARSLNGAIRKLAESETLAKAAAYGRVGVSAKCKALPGIGVGEVWIRFSIRHNSVYQTMRRVMGKDLDGRKVLMSRAPMTNPSVLKVRVIKPIHPMGDYVEADSIYLSPLGQMLNGGDFDGDPIYLTDANDSNLPVTTLKTIIDNVIARTGSDQLNPGASYWGDHFEILSADAVAEKRTIGKKNLSMLNDDGRKALPTMLKGSSVMFESAINWAHRIFLTSDLYLSLIWALQEDLMVKYPGWKPNSFTQNRSLVLLLAELYEIPLGGLDWNAHDAIMGGLVPIIRDLKTQFDGEQVNKFVADLEAAGIKRGGRDIHRAAVQAAECRKLSSVKAKVPLPAVIHGTTPEGFLCAVSEMSSLISKGDFTMTSKVHATMACEIADWLTKHDADGKLTAKSTVLMQIRQYLDLMVEGVK
jgi:hypothetical protein